MPLTILSIILTASVGFVAGLLGGLAGIGGSMVMLPALHEIFGEQSPATHHLYMAAAMIVNLVVAISAARRHRRLGGIRPDLARPLMVTTAIAIVAGVLAGNLVPGNELRLALAVFLVVYCAYNVARLVRGPRPTDEPDHPVALWKLIVTGATTGLVAGLLGLGGGVVMVPMLQLLCRVRLRHAIGTSSSTMVVTALVGATLKTLTLARLGEHAADAILLAALMAPGAIIGAVWGASLTHALPVRTVRAVITALLLLAAWRLAGAEVLARFSPPAFSPASIRR